MGKKFRKKIKRILDIIGEYEFPTPIQSVCTHLDEIHLEQSCRLDRDKLKSFLKKDGCDIRFEEALWNKPKITLSKIENKEVEMSLEEKYRYLEINDTKLLASAKKEYEIRKMISHIDKKTKAISDLKKEIQKYMDFLRENGCPDRV